MAAKNAIEQRLDLIEEHYSLFTANPDARVARWRLDGDGIGLVETFLEVQTNEGTSVPDFIMRLEVPFVDPYQHGSHLREAFVGELAAAADEMREAGVDADWQPPAPDPALDDVGQLLAFMHAFKQHYGDLFEQVVVVLMQSDVADEDVWIWWLDRLLQMRAPSNLRFMLFDNAAAPRLDALAERHPRALQTLAPDLDMPGAIDSLVRQVGGNSPADVYRRMFVGMSSAAQRGNIDGALRLGESAIVTAQRQGWTQQVAVVHMAAGAILMGAGRVHEALAAFQASGASASESRGKGDAGSDRVVLQAKLAEGSALLQAENYQDAAHAYEEVLRIAADPGPADPLIILEGRRMAAYCYEQLRRPDAAWHHLAAASEEAEQLDESMRVNSTLPYVFQSLFRITDDAMYAQNRLAVETRAQHFFGPDWKAILAEKTAT